MDDIEIKNMKDFENAILNGVVLIDFNAPWCGPCKAQAPVIDELEADFRGRAAIINVNVDEARDVSNGLSIQSIPTLIVFKNGVERERFIGLQPAEKLRTVLNRALSEN